METATIHHEFQWRIRVLLEGCIFHLEMTLSPKYSPNWCRFSFSTLTDSWWTVLLPWIFHLEREINFSCRFMRVVRFTFGLNFDYEIDLAQNPCTFDRDELPRFNGYWVQMGYRDIIFCLLNILGKCMYTYWVNP